ncbi:MAG: hypothetical protein HZA01_14775 [Nitrospinae bacterium]|nr:hypothetical protein [Nitrospinota bacterium]
MATALPLEIYEILEKKVGRDEAKAVIKIIDASLETIEKKAEGIALQKKLEIKDELTKELATKADIARLEGKIDAGIARLEGKVDADIARLEGKMDAGIARLEGKLDADIARLEGKLDADIARLEGRFEKLNQKLNFMIVLMIIALTLMNPVMAEVIKGFMK